MIFELFRKHFRLWKITKMLQQNENITDIFLIFTIPW